MNLEQLNYEALKTFKEKIKEVSSLLLKILTSTISNINNLETNFQLRFDN